MTTNLKISTLMRLAREEGAGRWQWTLNDLVVFVGAKAGHCRTIKAARKALRDALWEELAG